MNSKKRFSVLFIPHHKGKIIEKKISVNLLVLVLAGFVVLISSGAVYGDQQDQPLRENTPPDPRSPYAVSKLAAEHYVRTIGTLWGIETVSLRVFNAYGPGQPLPADDPDGCHRGQC